MCAFNCIVCGNRSENEELYPVCSRACENEVYDRGYEAYQDETETLNLSQHGDNLDYMENTEPVVVEDCIGYPQGCACDTCIEIYRAERA
jgi:endogenous inhibitor of DNA gyrase (YacG/DUF329 family)